jgi:hypothetical protein
VIAVEFFVVFNGTVTSGFTFSLVKVIPGTRLTTRSELYEYMRALVLRKYDQVTP